MAVEIATSDHTKAAKPVVARALGTLLDNDQSRAAIRKGLALLGRNTEALYQRAERAISDQSILKHCPDSASK